MTVDPEIVKAQERAGKLRRAYGITVEEYEELLDRQDGVCAICKGTNVDSRRLHVDHCHRTNKVRGLLCFRCNTLLGAGNDDVDLLQAAAEYLEITECQP